MRCVSDIFIKCFYFIREMTTLEQIHKDIVHLRKEMSGLKECFHEDFLELSEKTKRDIEESRAQLRAGNGISFEEVKLKLAQR